MSGIDFEDYRQSENLAPFIVARHLVNDDPSLQLVRLQQPAGDFSDPPLNDLAITVSLSAHRTQYRNGDFRFSGRAEPGRWTLIQRGEPNSIVIDDPNRFKAILVKGELADDLLARMFDGAPPDLARLNATQDSPLVPALIDRLWQLSTPGDNEDLTALYRDSVLVCLLGELALLAGRHTMQARGGLAAWQRKRVRDYLETYFARDIQLIELAGICGLSPDHCARAFKQSFGVTPQRYQMVLRLKRAQRLLEDTDLPVAEIARLVGYKLPQGLIRLFLREIRVTPQRYRRAFERP